MTSYITPSYRRSFPPNEWAELIQRLLLKGDDVMFLQERCISNPRKVFVFGMDLDEWVHESCIALFGVGDDWATLYEIESRNPGKGHATALLTQAKAYYEAAGKLFGGSVALNDRMGAIYKRLGITEYVGQ